MRAHPPWHRYQWAGVRLGRLQWWGAAAYTLGMVLYLIGDVANVVNNCPNTALSTLQFLWLISYVPAPFPTFSCQHRAVLCVRPVYYHQRLLWIPGTSI